ncbi:hypothetical protein BDQ17DRAFT_1335084 [Cyathus striatus]|nr:hypothetical protein BDQ17DRAFT_1335084 [Cyathus striatus]
MNSVEAIWSFRRVICSSKLFITVDDATTRNASRLQRKKVAVEKQKQKENKVEEAEARIRHDAANKTFELPLSSYKRKDDLRTTARALGLAEDKKTKLRELSSNIRVYVEDNSAQLH